MIGKHVHNLAASFGAETAQDIDYKYFLLSSMFESRIIHIVTTDTYFEQIELQAKLLNYFLGRNKSKINQSYKQTRLKVEAARKSIAASLQKSAQSVDIKARCVSCGITLSIQMTSQTVTTQIPNTVLVRPESWHAHQQNHQAQIILLPLRQVLLCGCEYAHPPALCFRSL